MEKTLPVVSLFLSIPIVYCSEKPWFSFFIVLGNMAGNIFISKLISRLSKEKLMAMEILKVAFNGFYVVGAYYLIGTSSPFWILHILSIFRAPITFPKAYQSLFGTLFLVVSVSATLVYLKVEYHKISLVVGVLISIGFLSVALFHFLNKVNETLSTAENKILKQQAQLVAASKWSALGEMAAGIAHEVNNPLMIIRGYAEKLESNEETDPDKLKGYKDKIKKNTDRINKIIEGLRIFARDASKDPYVLENINKVVNNSLELCQERLNKNGINLNYEGIEKDINLYCNPTQIEQVLINLINNSYHSLQSKRSSDPWIKIGVLDNKSELVIYVMDNGSGIPKNIQSRLFEPFFTTKPPGLGTGLGLSISKGIIEEHGGKLILDDNSPNTKFVINLPKKLYKKQDDGND